MSASAFHTPAPVRELPPIFAALHEAKNKSGKSFETIAKDIGRSEWWTAGL
jgi:hypothetical protein